MAVVKSMRCDVCGAEVDRLAARIMRVGTVEDRPEACTRLDIGPECYGEGGGSIADVIRAWIRRSAEDEPLSLDPPRIPLEAIGGQPH